MVMENYKSLKNGQKDIFLISHGLLTFLPLNFYQICALFVNIKKFSISQIKSAFSDLFSKMSRMQNCETVIEGFEGLPVKPIFHWKLATQRK